MLEPLLPLFGVWLLAVVTPGPDFLVVVQSATARSRRHGLATTVALLFGLPAVARVYDAGRRWIDRPTAAILVALGARLAVQR